MQAQRADHAVRARSGPGRVVAVCISGGSVPKRPVARAEVAPAGLVGDFQEHAKHRKPERAVSLLDLEVLKELRAEGFPVAPGVIGENLTLSGLHVQRLSPGDRLRFEGGPLLELTEPRKPCFVLDKIDPRLQHAVVGRCGFLARVVAGGSLFPGQRVTVQPAGDRSAAARPGTDPTATAPPATSRGRNPPRC